MMDPADLTRVFHHGDLDSLRSLRGAFRQLINACNKEKRRETDLGMLIAFSAVLDELHARFDYYGAELDRLEASIPGAGRSPASRAAASIPRVSRGAPLPAARGPAIAEAFRCMPESQQPSPPANPLSATQAGLAQKWEKRSVFLRPKGQDLPGVCSAEVVETQQGETLYG